MEIDILASGSSGNCCVINGEIAVDMGISFKKLRESGYVKTLKLLLLTHVHSDHFSAATVRTLSVERPTLRIGCCEWMVEPLLNAGIEKRVIDVVPVRNTRFFYQGLATIFPVELFHDVQNCGWSIVLDGEDEEAIFYATDTGTLSGIEAKNYSYYLVEANHTEIEITAKIVDKQSRAEFSYEMRAAKYHLSHERAMAWLAENAGPQSQYILLHQHREKEEP